RSISRHSGHHSNRHSDRRAVLIAVIAPDLDGRTKALRMDSLLIREKLQGALGSKTYNKSEEAGLEQT
ncbi:hypothetical protein L249_3882, partial [Ophiocordyceps polyrhachis-furcata BCC 54312]